MPPTPSPSPFDVIVHMDPAPWWQTLAPYAPLLAAIIAAWIAWQTLKERSRADNQAEWWRRAQWAIDSSLSTDPDQAEMGQKAIEVLGSSKLATEEELELLKVATADPLEVFEAESALGVVAAGARVVDGPTGGPDNDGEGEMAARASKGVTTSMTEKAPAPTSDGTAPVRRRSSSSRDHRVQIAAAKARVTLDKRLRVATPKWIIDLANEKAG
ncbi:hypothetical protein [Sinomonas soli]